MKVLLQRVSRAEVAVAGRLKAKIGQGLLLFVGVGPTDQVAQVELLVDKCVNLRIFPDDQGKMNLSLLESGGAVLVVSQFTLYGDCSGGRRPSFVGAAEPARANQLYLKFCEVVRDRGIVVETGEFGAHMEVSLVNDGPVTLMLES